MEEKGPLNFDLKAPQKLGERSSRAGRPPKGTVPARIGGAVSRLAADYVERRAPKSWTRRGLNMFMAGVSEEMLQGKEPIDLLERLAARKSIPLIARDDPLTVGLQFLETFPIFQGSIQVLYGPYVELLAQRPSLEDIHLLLSFCKHAQQSRLFKWFRGRSRRTRRAASDEARELRSALRTSKSRGHWREEFLDFLAIALGLFQEAVLTRDSAGFETWRELLLGPDLSFAHWPHCSRPRQEEMAALVHKLVRSAPNSRYAVPASAVTYMAMRTLDWTAGDIPVDSLVRFYLSLRDGGRPNSQREAEVLALALLGTKFPASSRRDRDELLATLRELRKGR